MRLYIIGDFHSFDRKTAERLMQSCDACICPINVPRPELGDVIDSGKGRVVVIRTEHYGKVVTAKPFEGEA